MSTNTFEDYLIDVHAKDYMGRDDDMTDSFNAWLETREVTDIIQYAEQFAAELNAKLSTFLVLATEAVAELRKIKEMAQSK